MSETPAPLHPSVPYLRDVRGLQGCSQLAPYDAFLSIMGTELSEAPTPLNPSVLYSRDVGGLLQGCSQLGPHDAERRLSLACRNWT